MIFTLLKKAVIITSYVTFDSLLISTKSYENTTSRQKSLGNPTSAGTQHK